MTIKADGTVGFGTTSPNAKLESLATTEQLRLSYDAGNYTAFTVGSDGTLIIGNSVKLGGATKTAGYFYTGTTDPTNTTRLNYDGYLYAKKLYSEGGEVAQANHSHATVYIPVITSPVNGNIPLMTATGELVTGDSKPADFQAADADLTAIAALGFASTSFLKKTAANTWALDTNTYAPTATGGSTGDMLKQTAGGGFISAGFSYSEVSLTSHNHDAAYSAIGHNHSGTYEPVLGNPSANAYLLSSTSAGVRSWISKNDVYTAFVTLTYGSSVTWTMSDGYNRKLTLTGDCVLTMSGLASGMSGCLIVVQDASGGHTLSFADTTHNKIIDGGLLTLDETANRVNILTFVNDGTDTFWSYGNNYLSPS